MEYQDEISAYLDAENSITARWLANTLRIDMTRARNSLSQYKKAQPDVSVSYLVAGVNALGGLSYIISDEVEIESVRNQLSSTRSEELYALHKIRSISNKAELQALECEHASELLYMTHPNSAEFYKNASGYIVCPNMDVKPIGQRILSSKLTVSSEPASEVRETMKTSVSKVLAPASVPNVLKSKSSIQATNFFGASATKPKPAAEAPAAVKAEPTAKPIKSEATVEAVVAAPSASVKSEEAAPQAQAKKVGKIVCDDEDEEWDSGYQPDAARLKERVDASAPARVSVGAVEDVADVDMTADGEESESVGEGEVAKAGGRKKGKQVVKHGAMDDYMEDIAIAAHIKAETAPADAPRPKKRKLVEKMFADEKGYLVTEMVWEEVTDDEGDHCTTTAASAGSSSCQPATKRTKPDSAAPAADATNKENGDASAVNKDSKKTVAPAAKAAKKVAEPAKAQKSMMSFFGKKA